MARSCRRTGALRGQAKGGERAVRNMEVTAPLAKLRVALRRRAVDCSLSTTVPRPVHSCFANSLGTRGGALTLHVKRVIVSRRTTRFELAQATACRDDSAAKTPKPMSMDGTPMMTSGIDSIAIPDGTATSPQTMMPPAIKRAFGEPRR